MSANIGSMILRFRNWKNTSDLQIGEWLIHIQIVNQSSRCFIDPFEFDNVFKSQKDYVVTIGGVVSILLVHKQNQSALIHGSTAQYSIEITS